MTDIEQNHGEVVQAFKMGCRACVFMAREIETLFTDLQSLEHPGVDPEMHLLPVLKFSISPAMNTLGGLLNGLDAVDDEAENATTAAFAAIRKVLEGEQ